jgi:CheY-like chemotaxis protein
LESQLQEAQKLESLGTLAVGIAHDFNNLLMGIQGNVSLMLLEANPNEKQYERLKSSEQYVLKGAELTRQLLGFARGGKYEVKPTRLNALIKKYNSFRSQIGIVILDLIMPGMSGTRTYRALKEINPNVEVLFSSGYSITGDLNHIISCGSDGFLQKPFDIHGLSQKIREVLEQNAIAMNHSSDVSQALPL